MFKGGEGVNAGVGEADWVVNKDRFKYDEIFDKLGPMDGKISGAGKIYTGLLGLFKN
jgi:EH domain-containing protein 1